MYLHVFYAFCMKEMQTIAVEWSNLIIRMILFTVICRDCTGHDVCNKPGDGHVLGNLPLECHGNHGESWFHHSERLTLYKCDAVSWWHKCWSVTMAFCFFLFCTRKRTRLHASLTWYHLCVSRQSITISIGIKSRCSFLSCTTRSVRHP